MLNQRKDRPKKENDNVDPPSGTIRYMNIKQVIATTCHKGKHLYYIK